MIRLYEIGGAAGLKPGRRGRCAGDKRSLSEEQELRLQGLICDKRPEQVKMDSVLWKRGAASHLIKPECGISMPIRTYIPQTLVICPAEADPTTPVGGKTMAH